MTAKLIVIGRGTAGAQAIAHFARWMECEVEWHFDPSISPQAVGEGSTLTLPINMYRNLGFSHKDLKDIDGSFKSGIVKEGWGSTGAQFTHDFIPPQVSYHFNAVRLQDYILNKMQGKVKIVEHNADINSLDASFIMDCSGKPSDYTAFNETKYIAVNSVHVNQCFWDFPRFQHTLTLARPYGWVFGIPLANRCSIGYLYNNAFNTLEEVQEDMKNIFAQYGLTPSTTTNTFSFKNYVRKKNYDGRVVYNGNASFFLEPLEATSVGVMDMIQRGAFDLWTGYKKESQLNDEYTRELKEIETFIAMHYLSSPYDTPFWDMAKAKADECFSNIRNDNRFMQAYKKTRDLTDARACNNGTIYGQWGEWSFAQNLNGLQIYDKLDLYTKEK